MRTMWLLVLLLMVTLSNASLKQVDPVSSYYQDFMRSLLDYAAWDASVDLINNPTPSLVSTFINENFVFQTMYNIPVNYIGYYFLNGTALFTIGYDYQNQPPDKLVAVPSMFLSVPKEIINGATNPMYRYTGQFNMSDGRNLLVVGAPIIHGNFQGSSYGFVLFGLYQNLLPSEARYFLNFLIGFAQWDVIYAVMLNPTQTNVNNYITVNMNVTNDVLFGVNDINFMAYYFLNGTLLMGIGCTYNSTTFAPVSYIALPDFFKNVPKSIISSMSITSTLYNGTTSYTGGQTVLVVGAPILTSTGEGPSTGFILFGRLIQQGTPTPTPSFALQIHAMWASLVSALLLHLIS